MMNVLYTLDVWRDCLKKFIECFVVGEGKWRSPGGSTKQFLSLDTDQTITWYAHILG